MGVVYRAYDPNLERNVALKLLAPDLVEDEHFRNRFLTESQLAAALEHPHAVPIHAAGEANGRLYIVMRYVEGTDLKALLATEAPLDAARALEICAQVAEALDAAHARGLVHRDVKPSNVLIDEREGAYLADFGLTRRLGDAGADAGLGLSLGTPAYVAPEQIEGRELDGRADQYSLACMLCECLSGRPPYPRATEAAVLFAHLEERPPASAGLDDVLGRALAKSPDDRFPSCRDLIEAARAELGPARSSRSRLPVVALALGAAVLGAVLLAVFLVRGGTHGPPPLAGNELAVIDPASGRVSAEIPVGARPGAVTSASGSLWVGNQDDGTISRVDPQTLRVTRSLPVGGTPTGLAASGNAVWALVADPGRPTVVARRVDVRYDVITRSVALPNFVAGDGGSLAASGKALWVAPSSGLLTKLDAASGKVVEQVDPEAGPAGVAAGNGGIWLTDSFANTLTRIDRVGRRRVVPVGPGPGGVAVGAGAVWVADALGDDLTRVDPSSLRVTARIPVGKAPTDVAVGAGSVWVANSLDGTVTRIDPAGGRVTATITVGGSPQSVAVADGRVWVTVQPAVLASRSVPASGGVAHLNAQGDGFSQGISPALWQIQYATCADLVNYPDVSGPAGGRLVPELAAAPPTHSPDGRTFTFAIRKGFRFSPPSNQAVTAQTVAYSIERGLSPKLSGKDPGPLSIVEGATAFAQGKASRLTGITVRGNRLIVRLTVPLAEPDLLWRLQEYTCVVPIGTPFDSSVRALDLPSAGPYYVKSEVPGQGVVLVRNPNYSGDRPHHLDEIDLTLGVSRQKTVSEIEAGTVDFAADGVPRSDAARLAALYGPGSPAARKGAQQYFVDPLAELDFLVLNTHRPLFRSAALRRAVSYAVDRRALVRLGDPVTQRGLRLTDQYLPPGMPGYRRVDLYPTTPDLGAAKQLAGSGSRRAVLVTCNEPQCLRPAQVVKHDLKPLGIDVQVKAVDSNSYFRRVFANNPPYDIAIMGWIADGPDPSDFLNTLLEGTLLPTLTDPGFRRRLAAAERLSGPRRYLAYEALDAAIAKTAAPWVAYGNAVDHDFFSARIGCQVYHPITGVVDLAALCLRKP